jgi:hypothetical protein
MKLKLDEAGHAVLSEGRPIYIHDDGKEAAVDVPATVATIGRLNGEAKAHRERAEAAEAKLKVFDGITDAEAARKALKTLENLDHKKLVDAGEVEKVKAEAIKAVEEKYKPVQERADKLERELYSEKIGGSFSRSKFIADKMAIPADMVQARFGQNFKIEEGRAVAYDGNGNKIFSRAKPGDLADFDEALETLVEQYPYREHILKGSGHRGDGATGNNGAGNGAGKTMKRSAFEAMPHDQRAAKLKEGVALVD